MKAAELRGAHARILTKTIRKIKRVGVTAKFCNLCHDIAWIVQKKLLCIAESLKADVV